MAEFERGDLVIVNMPGLDNAEPAIVSIVYPTVIGVRWLMHKLNHSRYYDHEEGADCMFWPSEYGCITKVGNIYD